MSLLRRQSQGDSGPLVAVRPGDAGFRYVGFAAHRLPAGATLRGETRGDEVALVVLGGRCTVRAGDLTFAGIGERADVWTRTPPYAVLLPPGTPYAVDAETALHLAVASAPAVDPAAAGGVEAAAGGAPASDPVAGARPRLITPAEVSIEHRGQGQTYRYIQHVLPPAAPARRLILVEVYTPAGNWSSFPPHKHDTERPSAESYLEEVYYYQLQPRTGFALQRVYTPDRGVDETLAPGDGDLVLVPRGYHPVAATPGHECYYLNVMAGPTRAWNFAVDPDYAHLMNWQKPRAAETAQIAKTTERTPPAATDQTGAAR